MKLQSEVYIQAARNKNETCAGLMSIQENLPLA